MPRKPLIIFFVVVIALGVGLGLWRTQTTEAQGPPTFSLPPTARLVAPGVFSLGTAIHQGRVVEGFAIADHKGRPHGKPGRNGGGGGDDPAARCFSFISKGAGWDAPEDYVFNSGGSGVGVTLSDLSAAVEAWDGEVAANVFGEGGSTTDVLVADTVAPNDANEVYFAPIDNPGTIAFTIVWGIFRGPPSGRHLVEWDMVFDNDEVKWSLVGETGKTDFLAVATHEAGHAAGMGHTDTSTTCALQTMFPFYGDGETHQRTLDIGDIAGINKLY